MGCLIQNFALFDPISREFFVPLFGVPTVKYVPYSGQSLYPKAYLSIDDLIRKGMIEFIEIVPIRHPKNIF